MINRLICWIRGHRYTNHIRCDRCGHVYRETVEIGPPQLFCDSLPDDLYRAKESLDSICNQLATEPKRDYVAIVPQGVWDDAMRDDTKTLRPGIPGKRLQVDNDGKTSVIEPDTKPEER